MQDPIAAIRRIFTEPATPDWFAERFLKAVSTEEMNRIVTGMTGRYGELRAVTAKDDGTFVARLERADVPTRITLDAGGRIVGLFFEAPIPTGGDLAGFVAEIAALRGATAVLVTRDDTVTAAHAPDVPLAVGSTFKLAVLKALKQAYDEGRLTPERVVRFDPAWRALPSGVLQDWPAGTPLTVATLAALMIAISDNTATGALIDIVGRDRIEAVSPRNTPFLTPAEMFRLMAPANAGIAAEWDGADTARRRAILDELAGSPLPAPDTLKAAPGAEWFFTAEEVCALLADVADMTEPGINPGFANRDDWQGVAYKGGSNIGVVSFATRLVAGDGTAHCVVAIWNDAGASVDRLAAPYRGILRLLADG